MNGFLIKVFGTRKIIENGIGFSYEHWIWFWKWILCIWFWEKKDGSVLHEKYTVHWICYLYKVNDFYTWVLYALNVLGK